MRNSKGFSIGRSTSFVVSALFLKVLGAMPRSSRPSEMSYLILSHQECPSPLWTAKRNHGCAQITTVACLSLRLIFITYTHILGVLLYLLFSEGFSHVHLHWRWHFPFSLIAITNGPSLFCIYVDRNLVCSFIHLTLSRTLGTMHIHLCAATFIPGIIGCTLFYRRSGAALVSDIFCQFCY